MAYKSPLASIFRDEGEDEDRVKKESYTAASTSALGNIFASGKTKKQEEDEKNKKRLDELSKLEKSKPKERSLLEKVGDFAAASNEALLGGLTKGAVNVANYIGSGFNAKEADKKTLDFLRNTGQTNQKGESALATGEGVDRNSGSFKAGQIAGGVQKTAVDIASLAVPAMGAEKVVKGIKGVQTLSQGGRAAKIASKSAQIAAGSAAGTAVGAVQDVANNNEQDLAKNAAIGTAVDIASPFAGKVLSRVAKEVGLDKVVNGVKAGSKSTPKGKAALEAQEAAEDAQRLQQSNIPVGENGVSKTPQNASQVVSKNDSAISAEIAALESKATTGIVTPEETTRLNQLKNENVGNAVENVATPPGQAPTVPGTGQSRYASKTLPDSDFVGLDTKDMLGSSYEKTTNAQRADTALQQMDAEGLEGFSAKVSSRLEGRTITDQTVFDAQAAAQALERQGGEANLQQAADIYNKLSTQLSKAGQTVQAASIMARQTPEGLSYYAQKQFNKAGVEFTPKLQESLNNLISAVKEAKPKSLEAAQARDNVQYFIAQNIPSSRSDKIINFWRAGLLTSPTTTGGAIVGNAAQAFQRNVITDPIATLADMVISLKTGERTTARAGLGSSVKGAIEGAKILGDKQYLKTGFNKLDPAQVTGKFDQPRSTNYGDHALGKLTGTYVNGVYKIMGSADLPFRNSAQSKALSSMARSEAINRGLKGSEAKDFVKEFVNAPPKAAQERAAKEAEAAVFANDTKLGTAASNLARNLGPVGQVLIPFAKVPSAVATKVITSTPIGTAAEIVKQIVNVRNGGKFDQRSLSKAIGEGTTGVPIIGAGYALGASGNITGGYPSTQSERDQWEAEGKKPNSIKVGDKWYSLNYIQPFASLLATGAKAREAAEAGLDIGETVAQAAAGMGQSVLSQSFLQGLSGAIDAVKNPADFGGKFIANTASGIVPNAIRAAATAGDSLQREANDPVSGLISGIPGLREGLQAKLDDNGEEVKNPSSFGERYFNPLKPAGAKPNEDTALNNEAIMPAKRLQEVRKKEINQLLADNRVNAAQRKIDEYNQKAAEVISPYVNKNKASISDEQMKKIDSLFLGDVWINKKGRPTISSRKDLPE